jgi:hypothetical protein
LLHFPKFENGLYLPKFENGRNLPKFENGLHLPKFENGLHIPKFENGLHLPKFENGLYLPKFENGHNFPKFENGHNFPKFENGLYLPKFENGIYPIVIVIGQVTKSDVFVGKNQIKHAVDVAAHLTIDEDDKSPTCGFRLFGVSKNRFGCAGREYVLDMQERGLQFKNRVGYVEEDYLEPAAAAASQKTAGGVVASRCLLKTLSLIYVVVWAAAGLLRPRLPSILQLQYQALTQHSLLIRLLSATAWGLAPGFPRNAQVQTHVQRSRCNRSFSGS